MNKIDLKKLAYSKLKVDTDIARRKRNFVLTAFTVALMFFGLQMLFSPSVSAKDGVIGGVMTASVMGVVGNIDQVDNKARTGKQVKSRLWVVSSDQIDGSVPFPALVGRTRSNIPLKAGEYWHYIDSVIDSPEPKWTGSEGDVATTLTNELPFIVGGMEDAVFNLLEQGVGKEFIVIWEICSTGLRFGGGNGCKGLKLSSFEGGSTKDNTSTTLTFKGECGELWYKYDGNTPTQAPVVVAANATTIVLTSNPQYQLTGGTAASAAITAFTGTADSDIGRVVTLIGLGGTYPATIPTGNAFILKDGATFTGNVGSQISFKVYKDGASSYKFIEVVGSRLG